MRQFRLSREEYRKELERAFEDDARWPHLKRLVFLVSITEHFGDHEVVLRLPSSPAPAELAPLVKSYLLR